MTPERWEQINKLYHAALEREPDQRADFLNQACADAELRREVERLIASHEQAGSFMEPPAAQVGERWQQIDRLLKEALTHSREQRAAFLAEACSGDEALIREVESLLAGSEEAGGFIETPPSEAADVLLRAKETRAMVGLTLGHYQIQSLLGAGGMGEVYRARDTRLGREVAVKILPEHLRADQEALRRFEREAKAVAALSHPNILAIHDFGIEQGVSYAVMEVLAGETLRECLSRGPLGWRRAAEIGAAVADGLAAAHAKMIIHRDLKPENIYLTKEGQVKILDFGIARVKQPFVQQREGSTVTETTRPGTVMGTFGYMSPEQVSGEPVDAPSDIFSLGCVLYEMVSRELPFGGEDVVGKIAAILRDEPATLAGRVKGVPEDLERVIRHCLEKKPVERFQSARDLVFDLKTLLGGGGTLRPAWALPTLRIHPAVWIAAPLVVLLAVIAVWHRAGGPEKAIDSLAVLPLVNASGDAELEYLSDGITESLINNLSQLPQLRVMARGTVFSYKGKEVDPRQVGKELHVRAVSTGKLNARRDTLSVQADLVNAADGAQLWGERYTRKLSDLLTVQEEIARHITEGLRLKLSGAEQRRLAKPRTRNIEAHQLYLKGRYHLNKVTEEGLKKALEYFKQAIDLDPNYALAYAGMADVYFFLSDDTLPTKEAMPRARAAALKALELDETLAEAHAALADVKWGYDWEWGEAERAYKRALELNPGYASVHNQYGIFLVVMGRFAEAQIETDRAVELDPLSPFIHVGTVWPLYFARQYDQAIEKLRRIVALSPDFSNAYLNLGWAYTQKGMYQEAIAALRKARSMNERWHTIASLGYAYAKAGEREEAHKALAELQERARRVYVSEYGLAVVHAGLGEKDQAFAAFERGYRNRDGNLALYLKVDPRLDSLRSDPRFTDLLRRLGLPP